MKIIQDLSFKMYKSSLKMLAESLSYENCETGDLSYVSELLEYEGSQQLPFTYCNNTGVNE